MHDNEMTTCPGCGGRGLVDGDLAQIIAPHVDQWQAWQEFYALTAQHDGPDGDGDG
jgi:hypothetical protein